MLAQGTANGPDAGDFIYLRFGTGTYSEADGINLANGQTLIGQGQNLVVNGVTIEVGSAGLTPTIQVTGAGGEGVLLAQNNTLSGFNISTTNAAADGIEDGGGTVGTLTISNVSIAGTGQAVDIDQGGTLNVTLASVTSTGSSEEGIQLAGVAGSFTASTVSLNGMTGDGIDLDNNSATVAINGGTIGNSNDPGGIGVDINGGTGNVTIGATINKTTAGDVCRGDGPHRRHGRLQRQHHVDQRRRHRPDRQHRRHDPLRRRHEPVDRRDHRVQLDRQHRHHPGRHRSGVGQQHSDHDDRHCAQRRQHDHRRRGPDVPEHCSNGAVNGIVLDSTGSSGGLTVTGVGTTAGSGGTVQNNTTRGASIVNASDITLKNMNFTNNGTAGVGVIGSVSADALNLSTSAAPSDTQANIYLRSVSDVELDNVTANLSNHIGIWGYSVNGLTLTNVTAHQNGDEILEDGVQLVNATGNITVTGGSFKDNASRSFEIQNNTGTPTVNIDGAAFGNTNFPTAGGTAPSPSNSTAASTVLLATNGTNSASITSTVTDSTFQNVFSIAFHVDMAGNISQNVTFGTMGHGNSILTASQGVTIVGTNSGGLTAKVVDNVLNNDETLMDTFASTNINVRRGGGLTPASGDWNVTIDSNEIGLLGNAFSGNEIAGASGISVDDQGSPSGLYKILIQNNTVYRVSGPAIQVGSANAGAHTVHATIINNTVADPEANAQGSGGQTQAAGIFVFDGTDSTSTTFANIEGNDVDGLWDTAGAQGLIRVRHGVPPPYEAGWLYRHHGRSSECLLGRQESRHDRSGRSGPYTVATSTSRSATRSAMAVPYFLRRCLRRRAASKRRSLKPIRRRPAARRPLTQRRYRTTPARRRLMQRRRRRRLSPRIRSSSTTAC